MKNPLFYQGSQRQWWPWAVPGDMVKILNFGSSSEFASSFLAEVFMLRSGQFYMVKKLIWLFFQGISFWKYRYIFVPAVFKNLN